VPAESQVSGASPRPAGYESARRLAIWGRATGARVRREVVLPVHRPHRYLLVVSPGRSGSTLVQGLLNTLPGTLIRGENGFVLRPLFQAERALRGTRSRYYHGSDQMTSAFYGIGETDADELVRALRGQLVRQLLGRANPTRVRTIGFKEIRWEEIPSDEISEFFDFVERLFPEARFVLNHRDPATTIQSGHWRDVDEATALAAIARVNAIQDWLRYHRPTLDTHYEVITGADETARDAALRDLAEFAGARCDDATLDRMRAQLRIGHGPYPFGRVRGRGRSPRSNRR
jgi:hypothetical protein